MPGYGPRGIDIDRNGIVWVPLASGHMGKFDRSKCKVAERPGTATGQHCPEGWTLYPFPGPQLQGVTDTGSAEASYYTWVDQFDTFGLGRNVPVATGNANDSLMALVDGKLAHLRVPYPLGFHAKGSMAASTIRTPAGRARGVWATYGTRTPFHLEDGKGTRQGGEIPAAARSAGAVRASPLAR